VRALLPTSPRRIRLSAFTGIDPSAVSGFLFAGGEEPGEFAFQIDEVRLR
jgi:hypothetical protein